MLTSIDRIRHAQIWDLLHEYADIRDRLEDIFNALRFLQQNLLVELEDLGEDFDDLQVCLNKTSSHLYRFKTSPDPSGCQQMPFDAPSKAASEEDFPLFPDEPEGPLPWDLMQEEG